MAKTLYVDSANGTRLAYDLTGDGIMGDFGHVTIWKMPPGSLSKDRFRIWVRGGCQYH